MKMLQIEDAVGQVLCHDMTRIVQGEMKGPQFRKGHIIQAADIPMLLSMGKEQIFVWEKRPGMLHEDEAAEALARICRGANIRQSGPIEGKIEFFAETDGLFCFDTETLNRINDIEDLVIAARHALSPVKAGDKLAGMKAVPLVIPAEKLRQAREAAGEGPLMQVKPYLLKSACVITTGSEIAKGLITDTFTPVIMDKLAGYGISVIKHIITGDGIDKVAGAIACARKENPDLILCTGGMSVDPDDNTPGAIRQSGAAIVSYGAPVMPGVMFVLGYYEDGRPIIGLPGCVMYAAATIFDIVLPRVAAGLPMKRRDFSRMGNGGLCLGCGVCHYPICPFGKG
ncbi:molybdopterin-binding protein [Treponema primitia]|nr:molybdopterin-binding protein [Treponema primitia]